ncbi:hybrid sensor histidine kinase/response regulator transcription factor [Marinilabilia rubra]|uniref:histidine kinase n=1 Tax=Marinilabilia rubra TaxID=2162893 RepID=A0A2U2B609_9BACT|nr:hybrid sensor histidine kinase/response regulator transcription factor [Marinilabilia rubra]PWD98508.1 hypothetical protein DDZ16_14815 [Marinilabilia rubra]
MNLFFNIVILLQSIFVPGQNNFLVREQKANIDFHHLSVDNGLAQASVLSINEDSIGFIWVGTKSGLSKYNGHEFINFKKINKLGENEPLGAVSQIQPFKRGDLLLVSNRNGLLCYDSRSENIVPFTNEKEQLSFWEQVSAIHYSDSSVVYMGTRDGKIAKFDFETKELKQLFVLPGGVHFVNDILPDKRGNLLIATNHGVFFSSKPFSDECINLSEKMGIKEPAGRNTRCLYKSSEFFWAGSHKGVIKFRLSGNEVEDFRIFSHDPNEENSLPHNVIRDIEIDNDGRLWFATGNGIAVLEEDKFKSFCKEKMNPYSLSDRYVYSLHFDKANNLWAGTYFGGLNVHYQSMAGYRVIGEDLAGKELRGRIVKSFLETDTELWIGTEDSGISIVNKESGAWRHLSSGDFLVNNNIQSLLQDRKGRIWIGQFRGGVTMIDKGEIFHFSFKPDDINSLSSNVVSFIKEDPNGNVWIGTFNRGLNLFKEDKKSFERIPHEFEADLNVVDLVFADESKILIQNNNILKLSSSNDVVSPVFITDGSVLTINTAAHMKDGQIWLATSGSGLLIGHISDDRFIIEKRLFPYEIVNAIVKDRDGYVWVSTNQSLFRVNMKGKVEASFYQHHGLDISFNRDAGICLSDGSILIGGINGFSFFKPGVISYTQESGKIILSDLYVNFNKVTASSGNKILSEPIHQTSQVELKYFQNNISLDFINVQYARRKSEDYLYRMKGLNNSWISNGQQRRVTFNNLDPGEYLFEVTTQEALDKEKFEKAETLRIVITPPWWKTNWAFAGYFLVFALLLYFFQRYTINRAHKKNALKLEKIEREKEKELYETKLSFFTNISHEIRTPLTLIIGPLEEYINHVKDSSETLTLKIIQKNTYRLLNLVNQILDFRKYEKKAISLNPENIDLVNLLKEVKELFMGAAEMKAINLELDYSSEALFVDADKEKMEELFFNLLSNAVKFAPEKSTVSIKLDTITQAPVKGRFGLRKGLSGKVRISIKDEGPGIPYDAQKQIFTPFYSSPRGSKGFNTGIGLALVKEIVDLHHGQISVESEENKGSVFVITLPVQSTLQPSLSTEVMERAREERITRRIDPSVFIDKQVGSEATVMQDSGKPMVLIVDDNAEMRDFVCKSLSSEYEVVQAENGVSGFETAKKMAPDIIVSDVAMPVMDGLTLVSKLKKDFTTSNIPVIILTVYNSFEKQVQGAETGADIYLTKPFQADLLRQWIKNLLEKQENLTDRIRHELLMDPSLPALASEEDMFLTEARRIMEDKMEDSQFTVDDLAEKMGVSRTVLYRKFKQIAGISPKDFIRQSRLKRAAQLLTESKMSIAEVTYTVGYNDLRYFREAFQKQFGVNPSEYSSNKNEI